MKTRHPGIRFEILGGLFERVAPLLRNGTIDIVLGVEKAFRDWSDLQRHSL